ncbi:MAG: triose-phosphate isomerase [Chloroflexi bacterium]|nr:triose-phosphate isomerase [Chloroflexota bacterium]
MNRDVVITPPFFEIGPKAYVYGAEIVALARLADDLGREHRVQVILTPQIVDLALVARAVESALVFAQHMDSLPVGRGVGSVLPEAVRAAGAAGVLLNHVERRLPRDELTRTMRRAEEVGLATMVCADDARDAAAIAALRPDVIIVESPELIAGGRRDDDERRAVAAANEAVWSVDPAIRVLHGAGITDASDVEAVIAAGAQGTGSSSAIFTAADPSSMLEAMIRSVRRAWDRTH